jgi:hypothetical protein
MSNKNTFRFIPYEKKVAEKVTAIGRDAISEMLKAFPTKKVYRIPFKKNGVPIDKVLQVTENSPLYYKLIENGLDFNSSDCYLEDID